MTDHKPVQTERTYLVSERELITKLDLTDCTDKTKIVSIKVGYNGTIEILTREGKFL